MKGYSLSDHRHLYGVWCAARAAQRGLKGGSNAVLRRALESTELCELMEHDPETWPATSVEFDEHHKRWCRDIITTLELEDVDVSYGRAAKLVSIYVKTIVIVGGFNETEFARVAHPPVDSILLTALSKSDEGTDEVRRLWRTTVWTKLDEASYFDLIETFRDANLDDPFWMIERYWSP